MDFHFQSWWNKRDQVYLPTLNTCVTEQNVWNKGFRTLDNRQCESDSWEKGDKQDESYDCFSLLPGESFQAAVQGGGKSPVVSLRRQGLEFREVKTARSCWAKYQRRGSCTENPRVLQGILSGLWVLICTCMWGNDPKPGKEPLERRRQNNPILSSHTGQYRPPDTIGHDIEISNGYCFNSGAKLDLS